MIVRLVDDGRVHRCAADGVVRIWVRSARRVRSRARRFQEFRNLVWALKLFVAFMTSDIEQSRLGVIATSTLRS